jgi:hypothetical protein
MNKRLEIEIKYAPGLEFDVPLEAIEIGQRTTGLKFLGVERGKDHLTLLVEGVGGRGYKLRVLSAAREVKIDGARLVSTSGQWRELEVAFTDAEAGVYSKKRINIAFVK